VNQTATDGTVVVVGGGIAGMTVALEVAEAGYHATIVETAPYLGGRVARMNQYFPKLCPPYCGMEINFQRIRKNPRLTHLTMAEVTAIDGSPGNYRVGVTVRPRFVNAKCTACGACAEACQSQRPDDFNLGMGKTKAAYLPHAMAFPMRYAIDAEAASDADWDAMIAACPYDAIERDMQPQETTIDAGAVVIATGWQPYDMAKLDLLGAGQFANVIRNVEMERLASPNGPTEGKILRPSDGEPAANVAFVQCAGSRDENHLQYCSGVCCLASIKQATYVREKNPEAKATVYYIDVRAPGRNEDFYTKVAEDVNVTFVKGKVADITEDPGTGNLTLVAEDTMAGQKITAEADLVVLATGMQPNAKTKPVPGNITYDDYGFVSPETDAAGIFAVGCAKEPVDVSTATKDATGAALRAIQCLVRE